MKCEQKPAKYRSLEIDWNSRILVIGIVGKASEQFISQVLVTKFLDK